jgi:hypothetical protein
VSATRRLAHGWRLDASPAIPAELISGFIRPPLRAVPPRMAAQLGFCRISLAEALGGPEVASRWSAAREGIAISLAAAGREEHDIALELLLCLGQALWTKLSGAQCREYWLLIDGEISVGAPGEIDEDALERKRLLLAGRASAANARRLEEYGAASFAGTAAEFVHCLWHDVTVRPGPDFLAPAQLRRRLKLLAGWYPPGKGRRLFA